MNTVHAYQICYDAQTLAQKDPGFKILDNLANQRPDWREYWPIRNFLIGNQAMEEGSYYGFLSPKFSEKTGLTSAKVIGFIENHPQSPDVFSFSPFFDQMAAFINIFEQGEAHHPGLLDCAHAFLSALGLDTSLLSRVGHSRNTIFCNYFFAKPAFWRIWLEVNEALFAYCEANQTEWAKRLNAGTDHAGTNSCPLKVFMAERTTTLLLLSSNFSSIAYKPAELPNTNSKVSNLADELTTADALKQAYCATEEAQYLHTFSTLRSKWFNSQT